MKLSKIEGLKMLKMLRFPTVDIIDPKQLNSDSDVLSQGLSVRTSPKKDMENNVYLPSIHNCTNLSEINDFISEHERDYNIIVHKTVRPKQIGSVSRYGNLLGEEVLGIDTFCDFVTRKQGIVKNQAMLPIYGGRFLISKLEVKEKDEDDFRVFSKIIQDVKHMPFKNFDAEFVLNDDGQILFTDLTIQSDKIKKQDTKDIIQESENKELER